MWQDVGKKIECCSDVITHVPSCGMDPGMACVMGSRPMSPVGQIETRNRNVYFELRKFPLRRDKGSAYWRTEESSRKRGKSFRSEKNVGGYDMNQVEGEHMISHREVCVCVHECTTGGRSGTIYDFPKGVGRREERPTVANRLSPTGPCPQIKNTLFVSKSSRTAQGRNKLQLTLDKSRYVRLTRWVRPDPGVAPTGGCKQALLLE